MKLNSPFKLSNTSLQKKLSKMFFAPRLVANLKVMMEQYDRREIIAFADYKVDVNEDTNTVTISYLLNPYEVLEDNMTEQRYDEHRNKLLYYCVRTAEMLTATKEVFKVTIEERMIKDHFDIGCVTKRMEIY